MRFLLVKHCIYILRLLLILIPFVLLLYSYIPLALSVDYTIHLTKISILKCEGVLEKFPMGVAIMSR